MRIKNIYQPDSPDPFKLSRSKIELFIECPRCFYLDRRLGVGRPGGFPFTLNNAVDALLKKEFDIHRANGTRHPLMARYGIDAVPFVHEDMDVWRENFKGIQYHHKPTNFLVTGAVDDVWQNANGDLSVVDYKATSTEKEITLEEEYRQGYKRQMEIYQWLLRKNNFAVSDTGYFVYVNGRRDLEAFDAKLEFDVQILPYKGSDAWIEKTLKSIKRCLDEDSMPAPSSGCEHCLYRADAASYEHE
jgi:CRISPR/Cas system-associated exonuclease Cas4 (RecB family)